MLDENPHQMERGNESALHSRYLHFRRGLPRVVGVVHRTRFTNSGVPHRSVHHPSSLAAVAVWRIGTAAACSKHGRPGIIRQRRPPEPPTESVNIIRTLARVPMPVGMTKTVIGMPRHSEPLVSHSRRTRAKVAGVVVVLRVMTQS